ncbi:MAG: type I-E CRISPR-associated protein Cse1/CasA [Solirubrobacterales bacterium]
MASFDLLAAPWIPVLRPDGSPEMVGLRDALLRASDILAIDDSSPLATVALHRLLLAIVHRAHDGPRGVDAWEAIWAARAFDRGWVLTYLQRVTDRFDLFDAAHPFGQVAGLPTALAKSVAVLTHEIASERNSALLFDHTTEAALTPAEAARALLACQLYAPGGLITGHPADPKRSAQAGPLTGTATFLVRGRTLFETLCLNLVRYDPADAAPITGSGPDGPSWERDEPLQPGPTPVRGYLDALTRLSRSILLIPDRTGDRNVVRRVVLLRGEERPMGTAWRYLVEPVFCAYRRNAQARTDAEEPWIPLRFEPARSLWRDSTTLLVAAPNRATVRPAILDWIATLARQGVGHLRRDRVMPLDAIGLTMAPGRASKPYLWRAEHLPVSPALLEDRDAQDVLVRAVAYAEAVGDLFEPRWSREDNGRPIPRPFLVLAMALASGGAHDHAPTRLQVDDAKKAVADPARTSAPYWSALDVAFGAFLEALAVGPDEARRSVAFAAWAHAVERAAVAAFSSATLDLERQPRAGLAVAEADLAFRRQLRAIARRHLPEVVAT